MTALDHIAIIISKEENIRFYVRLGFEEIRRIIRAYDTVIFMKNGNVVLEIFVDPNHPDRLTKPESLGTFAAGRTAQVPMQSFSL